MSNEALNWARSRPISDAEGKGVLIALADRADKAGTCFPSGRKLAQDTGKGDATVRRHLKKLLERGLIAVEPRKRYDGSTGSNMYRLLMQVAGAAGATTPDAEPFFDAEVSTPIVTVSTPIVTVIDLNPHITLSSSLSPLLDELEKNSPREILSAAFEESFFEVLLSEDPRRLMLWLALSSEQIADAIAQANDAPGNFRTNLKHRLDVDSGLAAVRTKKSSAGPPRRQERPPQHPTATHSAAPGNEHHSDPDSVKRDRERRQFLVAAELEQTELLDDLTAAGVPFAAAESYAVALYGALLAGDRPRAEQVRVTARRVVLEVQQAKVSALARDGP